MRQVVVTEVRIADSLSRLLMYLELEVESDLSLENYSPYENRDLISLLQRDLNLDLSKNSIPIHPTFFQ